MFMDINQLFRHKNVLEKKENEINCEQNKLLIELDTLKQNEYLDPFSFLKNNNDILILKKKYNDNLNEICNIKEYVKNFPKSIYKEISKEIISYHQCKKKKNSKIQRVNNLKKYFNIAIISGICISLFLVSRKKIRHSIRTKAG